jgi:peptide-methionine (S)-S-oxide reductase
MRRIGRIGLLAVAVAWGALAMVRLMPALAEQGAERAMPAPIAHGSADDKSGTHNTEDAPQIAVLAGGCFWGVQGVFEHVHGVKHVLAGYAGGTEATAQYVLVSGGGTDHAESVQIEFDPKVISYEQILQVFFSVALDPTQHNRQGPDMGRQYRSEIFYATPEQQAVARRYISQLDQGHYFSRPIATKVDPLHGFYPAEAYHQDYLVRHPDSMYIVVNDIPKVESLKRLFPDLYQEAPVLAAPPPS